MKKITLLFLSILVQPLAAQEAPDMILFNGKIVTVDDHFSIQEAIAIRGEQILSVGSDSAIRQLSGTNTVSVDLGGKTVIPGLIDNHNHIIRATEYWPNEARLDGVSSRDEALQALADKVSTLPAGEWLMTLGGWTENQFADSREEFSRAELDEVAPDRPAFIQSTYDHALVNTAWLREMDIPIVDTGTGEGGETGLAAYVERDGNGEATGRMNGGMSMVRLAIERFPTVTAERQVAAIESSFTYLNSIGLTSVFDPAGVGISDESYTRLGNLARDTGISVRVFHTLGGGVPASAEEAAEVVNNIRTTRPFQGDKWLDLIAVGEIYYGPFHWDSLFEPSTPGEEDIAVARSILHAAAEGGWQVQTHASQPETIDLLLDIMTEINEEHPLRQLRWSVTHADLVGIDQIERMKHLGMNLQMRSVSVLTQPRRYRLIEELGDAAYSVPPLRLIQGSGIPWGLGTDGTKASQINPFVTLWWAVTGYALNGDLVLRETLSREEALIAHTRSNAYLMFQESYTGSLRPGMQADLLVLDRDYLTVPEDEIREILPTATVVGGKLVWGSF